MESFNALSQTEETPMSDAPVQACVEMRIRSQQTDIATQAVSMCQTDSSCFLVEDQDSQTFIPVQDFISQTEVITQNAGVNATVEECYALVQTDIPQLRCTLSQTDISVANMVDSDMQTSVETANKIAQIGVENQNQLSQTTSSIFQLTEANTQVETEFGENESQTDATDVEHAAFQTEMVRRSRCCCVYDINKIVSP
jgi:hypothetical protein